MKRTDTEEKKPAAYQAGPFDEVRIQEALTIIAIYAAKMDYENSKAEVKHIEEILENHPLFAARRKEIFALINKYANEMKARDPDKALAVAIAALTPEQKKIAFELAVDVALQVKNLADYKEKALDTIKSRLAVSNEFAQQVFQAKIGIVHR